MWTSWGMPTATCSNLMASTAIATIFLDRQLRITRYTPSAVELFNLIPTDVGRPLTDLTHRLEYGGLERDAGRVLENLAPIERDVGRSGGRWFLVRILPYRTVEDRIAGVVLTFVDVTDLRNTREALRTSEDRYLNLFNSVDEAVAVLEKDRRCGRKSGFQVSRGQPRVRAAIRAVATWCGTDAGEVLPDLEPAWMRHFLRGRAERRAGALRGRHRGAGRWFDVFVSRIGGPGSVEDRRHVHRRDRAQERPERVEQNQGRPGASRDGEHARAFRRQPEDAHGGVGAEKLEEARTKLLLDFATAQEDERNRVARDLHDSLGQHLAALMMGFKTRRAVEDCPPPVRARILQMQETARRLDEEIDRLTHALAPAGAVRPGTGGRPARHRGGVVQGHRGLSSTSQIIEPGLRGGFPSSSRRRSTAWSRRR